MGNEPAREATRCHRDCPDGSFYARSLQPHPSNLNQGTGEPTCLALLRPAFSVAATAAALVLAAPSALAAPTVDPLPSGDNAVSVAVFGDHSLTVGQELTVADLANAHGVDATLVQE